MFNLSLYVEFDGVWMVILSATGGWLMTVIVTVAEFESMIPSFDLYEKLSIPRNPLFGLM